MTVSDGPSLHLFGQDAEDLSIISACLQDAVTWRADMAYLKGERRFALVLNRYCWEREAASNGEPARVRTGLHFDSVTTVKSRGISRGRKIPLELLAVQVEEGEHHHIAFHFAGGASIVLEVECLDCQMHDLSHPWTTHTRPSHPENGESGKAED
jgi:hypothetical protein